MYSWDPMTLPNRERQGVIMRIRLTRGRLVGLGAAVAVAAGAAGMLGITSATAAPATARHCGGPTVGKQYFGATIEPYTGKLTPTYRYTLTSCRGMQVKVLTFGGIVQSIRVPSRSGKEADVVLGFKTLNDYVTKDSPPVTANGGPYFGETIGRYGNRIAKGTFKLDGNTYTLPINNGVNSLHGGIVGFGNHIWSARAVRQAGAAGVQLKLVSPNGDQGGKIAGCATPCTGYPGQLTTYVTFLLTNHNQLLIHYNATVKGAGTVLNLTNHSYFNLAGESSGATYAQKVYINAKSYTPTDSTQIPTGQIAPVKGTPFDFNKLTAIGARINENNQQLLFAQGYDHNWVLNRAPKVHGLTLAAQARDPQSGRLLTVLTDQPGVQFYSGNFLNGTLVGISGHTYRQSAGYTFETQHYPDSPNEPTFPSTELKPGQQFNSTTIFAFSTR